MPGWCRASSGTPKEKTEVVLVDAMDEANGMTSVLPYNQMILLPDPAPGRARVRHHAL